MVRCIPTFIIISLIASLSLNHPIGVEEIVETVGIQAVGDDLFDFELETDAVHAEAEEEVISVVGPPYVVTEEEYADIAGIQAVENEEDDVAVGIQGVEEDDVVGIQGVEEDDENIQVIGKKEKDVIVGIQGVEEFGEDDIVEVQAVEDSTDVAEDNTDVAEDVTSSSDAVIQTSDDQLPGDDMNMEFELFEEKPEETTTAAVIEDEIVPAEEEPENNTTDVVNEDKTELAEEEPDEVAVVAVDEEPEEIVIAAVEEEPEVTIAAVEEEPEVTVAAVINDNIVPVQNTEPVAINSESATAFKKLAEDTLNKLKFLHIFSNDANVSINNKRDSDSENSDSDNENENDNDDDEDVKNVNYFEITEVESENETQGIDPEIDTVAEIFTNYFEENPTEFITEPIDPIENVTPIVDFDQIQNNESDDDNTEIPIIQKKQDDDDFVEIALYEVDDEIVKSNFDIVTEMITDVPVETESASIDDENQPTIGAIAIEEDVEEEIPLYGVVIEVDEDEDEVAIAEFAEDSDTNEEANETIAISSNVLIDLSEESDAVETDAATDDVDEEPTMIN